MPLLKRPRNWIQSGAVSPKIAQAVRDNCERLSGVPIREDAIIRYDVQKKDGTMYCVMLGSRQMYGFKTKEAADKYFENPFVL